MKSIFKGHNASLVNYTFQTLLITYLFLLFIEQIWAGFVSTYLNLNYLLVIVIILGCFNIFSEHSGKAEERINKKDYFFITLLGIASFLIIKFKTADLDWLSWVISIITGVLIILLNLLILNEKNQDEN